MTLLMKVSWRAFVPPRLVVLQRRSGSASCDEPDVDSDDGGAQADIMKRLNFPDVEKEQPAQSCPKVGPRTINL